MNDSDMAKKLKLDLTENDKSRAKGTLADRVRKVAEEPKAKVGKKAREKAEEGQEEKRKPGRPKKVEIPGEVFAYRVVVTNFFSYEVHSAMKLKARAEGVSVPILIARALKKAKFFVPDEALDETITGKFITQKSPEWNETSSGFEEWRSDPPEISPYFDRELPDPDDYHVEEAIREGIVFTGSVTGVAVPRDTLHALQLVEALRGGYVRTHVVHALHEYGVYAPAAALLNKQKGRQVDLNEYPKLAAITSDGFREWVARLR